MGGITQDLGSLLLRLTGFYLAFAHGWGKVAALASGEGGRFVEGVRSMGFPFAEGFAWAAAGAEVLGGLLVGLGLLTRVAAGFAAFTMLVAAFLHHKAHLQLLVAVGARGASAETLQSWGSPEMALLYLAILGAVVLFGPGRFSLDHMFWERHGRRPR